VSAKIGGKDESTTSANCPLHQRTPLIDVLLVLLIIFMVISPMKPSRFEAQIPKKLDQTRRRM
jgi:biopolymer transport protein ExbD